MASTSTPPVKLVKDQYHHAIPRFILRRFQVSVELTVTSPERKRKQLPQEYIYYYNLETREVELRAIAAVYGSTNLYKDARNPDDVMELEKKLSVLESKAGRAISDIHKTIGVSQRAILRRGDLEDLRRFLFIMHYRSEALSLTYFQEDHPDNVSTRAWMKAYRERYGLHSAVDMWLHMLRYYLDEPHEQMIADYYKTVKKYGPQYQQMLTTAVDPSTKYEALAYGAQAGSFYMSIWEAADDEEFLLGHTSFGLWEGLVMGSPAIHRVFVVSPRIAIILRSQLTIRTDMPRNLYNSDLLDIPAAPADVQYCGDSGALSRDIANDPEKLFQYRRSAQARGDMFTFTKTKLTIAQTDTLNAVILRNVRPEGSLTFHSAQSTLRALRKFISAPDFENYLTKHLFAKLVESLSCPSLLPIVPKKSSSATSRVAKPSEHTTSGSGQRTMPNVPPPAPGASSFFSGPAPSFVPDHPLRTRLRELMYADLAGVAQFKSRYGTAYAIYRLCQHDDMPDSPLLSEQRASIDTVYLLLTRLLKPPPPGLRPRPESLLVKDMSGGLSSLFFATFGAVWTTLKIEGGDDSWLSNLTRQVAMVELAERLAQKRPDAFDVLTEKLPTKLLR